MSSKKQPAKRRSRTPRASPPAISREDLEPMVLEVFGALGTALSRHGLGRAAQRELFRKSQAIKAVMPASAMHLNQIRPLGDLLTAWLEEMPYLSESGKPKVLPITGRGATFETLAKRFLPGRPLAQVVEAASRFANVGTLPGGRIALYGDMFVDLARTPLSVLAQMILHVKQIVDTCLYNSELPQGAAGRTERIVNHVIRADEFSKLVQVMRPQIHDVCERLDRLLKSSAEEKPPKPGNSASAGIGVYVYYDGTVEHVRNRRAKSRG